MPSCIRAPPEAQNRTSGSRSATARSQARAMRSPVPVPSDPPMNAKSITPSIAGWPSMRQTPITTDSVSPLFAIAASTLSR